MYHAPRGLRCYRQSYSGGHTLPCAPDPVSLRICRERADHDATSAAQGLGEGEPRESLAHLLKWVVNPPGSNPSQRRDRLLDALGRDPAQTYAIVRAWLYQQPAWGAGQRGVK